MSIKGMLPRKRDDGPLYQGFEDESGLREPLNSIVMSTKYVLLLIDYVACHHSRKTEELTQSVNIILLLGFKEANNSLSV
jgi:hypothetical protein